MESLIRKLLPFFKPVSYLRLLMYYTVQVTVLFSHHVEYACYLYNNYHGYAIIIIIKIRPIIEIKTMLGLIILK